MVFEVLEIFSNEKKKSLDCCQKFIASTCHTNIASVIFKTFYRC